MIKIKLCDDFSKYPGGRLVVEGDHSGEEFRDTLLIRKYEEAEATNDILQINFDGCYGVGTSFLEEAFGGLARKYNKKGILKRLEIISTEDETIPINIEKYVSNAELLDK